MPAPLPSRQRLSVVVPVFRGEQTLPALVAELAAWVDARPGAAWSLSEVCAVWDHGPDASLAVLHHLAEEHAFLRVTATPRNLGQHAATTLGLGTARGNWVVTIDEDGQHDPRDIDSLLASAQRHAADLVHGVPTNPPPHGWLRNTASHGTKLALSALTGRPEVRDFSSFRLLRGDFARWVAPRIGADDYLDVRLVQWTPRRATAPVTLRPETRPSGYTWQSLARHSGRLARTAWRRP